MPFLLRHICKSSFAVLCCVFAILATTAAAHAEETSEILYKLRRNPQQRSATADSESRAAKVAEELSSGGYTVQETKPLLGPAAAVLGAENVEGLSTMNRRAGTRATRAAQDLLNVFKLTVPSEQIDSIVNALERNSEVEYAVPNETIPVQLIPNDPLYASQYAHTLTEAAAGWDVESGDPSVVIAVIDTGVQHQHEDLKPNMLADCVNGCPANTGYDFADTTRENCSDADCTGIDNDPMDFQGHGTFCSGIAAARGNNGIGVTGACPNCSIMPIRAGYATTDGAGALEIDDIANSIVYATNSGADVISMSFGSNTTPHPVLSDALDYAHDSGVLLIAAAGNSNISGMHRPGGHEAVISVAATGAADERAEFSNWGFRVDIAAPGDNIRSTMLTGGRISNSTGYGSASGTSASAPFVAGLVGLLLSRNPGLTAENIEEILYNTSDPVTSTRYIGAGRVNVRRALEYSLSGVRFRLTGPDYGAVFHNRFAVQGVHTGGNLRAYIGTGAYPTSWTELAPLPSENDLAAFSLAPVGEGFYTVRLTSTTAGRTLSQLFHFTRSADLKAGWPRSPGTSWVRSTIADDLNFDGTKELLLTVFGVDAAKYPNSVTSDVAEVYVMNGRGEALPGWPRPYPPYGPRCVVTGNFDGDHYREIAVVGHLGWFPQGFAMQILELDGSVRASWVSSPLVHVEYCPTVVDVDGDGVDEVLFVEALSLAQPKLHLMNGRGSHLPGFPKTLTSLGMHPLDWVNAAPVVADVNGDGTKEILLNVTDQKLYVINFSGEILPGWPVFLDSEYDSHSSAVVADLDKDGTNEIVIGTGRNVTVLNHHGQVRAGWPRAIESLDAVPLDKRNRVDGVSHPDRTPQGNGASLMLNTGSARLTPVLADMDNNGNLEIILGSGGSAKGMILRHNGELVSYLQPDYSSTDMYPLAEQSQPVIVDVDNDGDPDIIQTPSRRADLYVWNMNGKRMTGFPRRLPAPIVMGATSTPVVTDFEQDGKLDIVFGMGQGTIYAYELTAGGPENVHVPMYQNDPSFTGRFKPPVDECPADNAKWNPGPCGCGNTEVDSDGDQYFDCADLCPADGWKSQPGACGCGAPETDSDNDGTPDCVEPPAPDPTPVPRPSPPPDLNVPVTPNVIGSPASVVVTGSPVPGAKIKGFVFELVGPNGKVKRYSSKKAAKAWKKESLKTPGVWLVRYHVKLKKGSSPWSPVNQFTVLESEVSKPRGKK